MTEIKEIHINTIGEPAHVKVERNSKGHNYEVSLHGENLDKTSQAVQTIVERLEALYYREEKV